jgi:hypothetical protein
MNGRGLLGIAGLVVVGIIIADVLTHPTGTAAASTGIANLWGPSVNGLLGKTTAPAKG